MGFTLDYSGTDDAEIARALLSGLAAAGDYQLRIELDDPEEREPVVLSGELAEVDHRFVTLTSGPVRFQFSPFGVLKIEIEPKN